MFVVGGFGGGDCLLDTMYTCVISIRTLGTAAGVQCWGSIRKGVDVGFPAGDGGRVGIGWP